MKSVKVNKTFSIDLWILKEMTGFRNKSQFVCDAIKAKLSAEPSVSIADMPARQVMAALCAKDDVDPFIKRVLLQSLSSGTNSKHSVSDKKSLSSNSSRLS